jgi:hypothetical protein
MLEFVSDHELSSRCHGWHNKFPCFKKKGAKWCPRHSEMTDERVYYAILYRSASYVSRPFILENEASVAGEERPNSSSYTIQTQ